MNLIADGLFKIKKEAMTKNQWKKKKVLPQTFLISTAKFSNFSSTSNAHSFNTSLVVTEFFMLCFCRVDVFLQLSLDAKVLSFKLVDSTSPPAAAADDDAYITYFKTIRKLVGS